MPDCYDLKKAFISAYQDLLDFYQSLEKGSIVNPNGKPLVYRNEQYLYSEAIMKALLDNKILIFEAGVGTGKSIGYLLPIFFSMKNGKEVFKKVIISTSSIALQRQLKNDIKTVSKLLEFDIDVSISKGNGNYACYQEITNAMNRSSDNNTYKKLSEIRDYIIGLSSWDRDAMDSELVNPFWDSISLKSRTLCKECEIKQICPFYREQARIGQSNKPEIIILNNAKLSAALRQENSELITSADAIIIDEAHTLIPQMRLTGEGTINFANLERILNNYIIPKFYESFQQTKARGLISEFRQLNTDTIAQQG